MPAPFLRLTLLAFLSSAGTATAWAQQDSTVPPPRATAPGAPAKPKGLLPIPDYTGDIWQRGFLAGDLFDARTALAEKGLQYEVTWTQSVQSVTSGGLDTGTRYGGNLEYSITADLDRMGVMPGAMISFMAETRYGESVNGMSGLILPVNLLGLVPIDEDDVPIAVTELMYTQFLSEHFAVFVGKLNLFSGDPNPFAGGRGMTQFMNFNLVFNGVQCLAPYSTPGAGLVWLPTPDISVNSSVFATEDASTTSGFETVGDGWTWATEADFQYRCGDLPGGVNVGFLYSWDSDFTDFDGRFTFQPGEGLAATTKDTTWAAYTSGWQYLYTREPVKGKVDIANGAPTVQGLGLFWRAGFADNDTNPVNWSVSGGIGGRGLIPGREHDNFGVGFYYSDVEINRLTNSLGFDRTVQGFEAFYGIAITPAVQLTLDLQVVDSPIPDTDSAVILGARLFMRF